MISIEMDRDVARELGVVLTVLGLAVALSLVVASL